MVNPLRVSGFVMKATACGLAWAVLLLLASAAGATNFTGYGETGWNYDNKGYCCEDALQAAQDHGASSCEASGGHANIRGNSVRGRCDWETSRGRDGGRVYRCTATASVSCR